LPTDNYAQNPRPRTRRRAPQNTTTLVRNNRPPSPPHRPRTPGPAGTAESRPRARAEPAGRRCADLPTTPRADRSALGANRLLQPRPPTRPTAKQLSRPPGLPLPAASRHRAEHVPPALANLAFTMPTNPSFPIGISNDGLICKIQRRSATARRWGPPRSVGEHRRRAAAQGPTPPVTSNGSVSRSPPAWQTSGVGDRGPARATPLLPPRMPPPW